MATLWLGIDVDGTIAEGEEILPWTRAVLRQAREAGVFVILASGRRPEYLQRISQECGLLSPLVALDGALVEGVDGEVVSRLPMADEDVAALAAAAHRLGLTVVKIGDRDECLKVVVSGAPQRLDQLVTVQRWPRMRRVNQFVGSNEWVRADCSKGHGFDALCARYGRPDQLIVFGNDWNDREMFEVADFAYVLPSAPTKLQAMADQVLPPIQQEPVARVIVDLLTRRARWRQDS